MRWHWDAVWALQLSTLGADAPSKALVILFQALAWKSSQIATVCTVFSELLIFFKNDQSA